MKTKKITKKIAKKVAKKIVKSHVQLWLVESYNSKTNASTRKRVRMSYDSITKLIDKKRQRNNYIAVSATEIDKDGSPKTNGRIVAECSRFDEDMIPTSTDLNIRDMYNEEDLF